MTTEIKSGPISGTLLVEHGLISGTLFIKSGKIISCSCVGNKNLCQIDDCPHLRNNYTANDYLRDRFNLPRVGCREA